VADSTSGKPTSRSRGRVPGVLLGLLACATLLAPSDGDGPRSALRCFRSEALAADVAVAAPARPRDDAPAAGDRADGGAAGLPLELKLEPSAMKAELGHAWIVALPPEWAQFSSNVQEYDRSHLRLTENGVRLGPANATHAEIREDGRGAYSHWLTALYFSTSDNSDPRKNGRVYAIEVPASEE
jgi:hypothetical protein